MLKLRYLALLLFFTLPSPMMATQLEPWFGNDLEIELRGEYTFQFYRQVNTVAGTVDHRSNDHFIELSSNFAKDQTYSIEMEFIAGATSQHNFAMNCESATFRYSLLNDLLADPISLMAGLTVRHVHSPALHDISNFYHGSFEFEPTLAFGKECSCREFWTSRWWGVLGVGIANEGSPWLRGDLHWEKNWWNEHQFRIFARTLWGFGERDLDLSIPFEGYGDINHQSIDLGIGYRYEFICSGITFTAEYAHRVYGKNAPINNNIFYVCLMYPIDL